MFTLAGNEHKRNSWKDAIWCNLPYLTCDQFILNLKLSDCKMGLDAIVFAITGAIYAQPRNRLG